MDWPKNTKVATQKIISAVFFHSRVSSSDVDLQFLWNPSAVFRRLVEGRKNEQHESLLIKIWRDLQRWALQKIFWFINSAAPKRDNNWKWRSAQQTQTWSVINKNKQIRDWPTFRRSLFMRFFLCSRLEMLFLFWLHVCWPTHVSKESRRSQAQHKSKSTKSPSNYNQVEEVGVDERLVGWVSKWNRLLIHDSPGESAGKPYSRFCQPSIIGLAREWLLRLLWRFEVDLDMQKSKKLKLLVIMTWKISRAYGRPRQ